MANNIEQDLDRILEIIESYTDKTIPQLKRDKLINEVEFRLGNLFDAYENRRFSNELSTADTPEYFSQYQTNLRGFCDIALGIIERGNQPLDRIMELARQDAHTLRGLCISSD